MPEFFYTPAGVAVITVVFAALFILIIDLNYKLFAKRFLDILFSFCALAITSPYLLVVAIISIKRSGKLFEYRYALGYKGKIIRLRSVTAAKYANWLAMLADVLCGSLSFVGIKPLSPADGALLDDKQIERFSARPGIFCYLSVKGGGELTYSEMFALDSEYAARRELFYDIWISLKCFSSRISGEKKSYLGETAKSGYAESLLNGGALTQSGYDEAQKCAEEAIKNCEEAEDFKRRKRDGVK